MLIISRKRRVKYHKAVITFHTGKSRNSFSVEHVQSNYHFDTLLLYQDIDNIISEFRAKNSYEGPIVHHVDVIIEISRGHYLSFISEVKEQRNKEEIDKKFYGRTNN